MDDPILISNIVEHGYAKSNADSKNHNEHKSKLTTTIEEILPETNNFDDELVMVDGANLNQQRSYEEIFLEQIDEMFSLSDDENMSIEEIDEEESSSHESNENIVVTSLEEENDDWIGFEESTESRFYDEMLANLGQRSFSRFSEFADKLNRLRINHNIRYENSISESQ